MKGCGTSSGRDRRKSGLEKDLLAPPRLFGVGSLRQDLRPRRTTTRSSPTPTSPADLTMASGGSSRHGKAVTGPGATRIVPVSTRTRSSPIWSPAGRPACEAGCRSMRGKTLRRNSSGSRTQAGETGCEPGAFCLARGGRVSYDMRRKESTQASSEAFRGMGAGGRLFIFFLVGLGSWT